MSNLKQAKMDTYNESVAKKIESVLAPSGFQKFRDVDVAIRERVTKKDVNDITYMVLLKIGATKVEMLKYFKRNIDKLQKELQTLSADILTIENQYTNGVSQFLGGKHSALREMRERREATIIELAWLQDHRSYLSGIGPMIPDSVMKTENL